MALATSELTTTTLDGTGVFDELMKATTAHLEREHKGNRIKGTEYANVYLGSLVAVMDQAVKFLSIRQQDALIAAQIAKLEVEKELVAAEVAKAEVEKLLVEAQVAKLELDKDLVAGQIQKVAAETALVNAQLQLIPDQRIKLQREADLLQQQEKKTEAEKEFIRQKHLTEIAQILDEFETWNGTPVVVSGVICKQKELYAAQRDGFERKAQESAAKLLADIWSVQRTTDEGVRAPATVDYIGQAIAEVVNNSGLTTQWASPPVDPSP